MLAEYKCVKCGKVCEEYFATFAQSKKTKKCSECGGIAKKVFGRPSVRMGGEVSGYEKENADSLTLGKAVDMKQRWV